MYDKILDELFPLIHRLETSIFEDKLFDIIYVDKKHYLVYMKETDEKCED